MRTTHLFRETFARAVGIWGSFVLVLLFILPTAVPPIVIAQGTGSAQWSKLAPSGTPPSARSLPASAYDTSNDRLIVFGGDDGSGLPHENDVWVLTNAGSNASAPAWLQLNPTGTPPPGRIGHTAVYDPNSNRLIVHAGCAANCGSTFADTWVLSHANGSGGTPSWTQLPSASVGRAWQVAGYNPSSNRMIIFGGDQGAFGTERNDVQVLTDANGSGSPAWIQLSPTGTPPPARSSSQGIYDAASNRLTIFGGFTSIGGNTHFNDVWVLTNADGLGGTPTWIPLTPSGTPPAARRVHSAVYDPATNRMIVFGGCGNFTCSTLFNDVWVLTAANGLGGPAQWIQLTPSGGPPATRDQHIAAYLPSANRMIIAMGNNEVSQLFNDVWALNNANGNDGDSNLTPWTFMLYLDGDSNLYADLKNAIRALEALPANSLVQIVVLFDGDGVNDSRRFLVQPGGNYTPDVNYWTLAEQNMGDPKTLSDFIGWTHDNYPAQHYYLAIADHGRGTSGVAWDTTNGNDNLTTADLRTALRNGTNDGQWKIDILHYDNCLMAMLEDAYQAKDDVTYMVASENLGWSLFAYARYVQSITATTTPRQLAINVADSYFSDPNLQGYPRTISALDLGQAAPMRQTLDALAAALRANLDPTTKAEIQLARKEAQKFDSQNYHQISPDDEYLDLYDLAARLQLDVTNTAIQQAAQAARAAIGNIVIAEHHQSGAEWNLDNAHGLALYFPLDKSSSDYSRYVSGQLFQFTADSQWDEFLAEYFGPTNTPQPLPDPGLPPMLKPVKMYVPIIVR